MAQHPGPAGLLPDRARPAVPHPLPHHVLLLRFHFRATTVRKLTLHGKLISKIFLEILRRRANTKLQKLNERQKMLAKSSTTGAITDRCIVEKVRVEKFN